MTNARTNYTKNKAAREAMGELLTAVADMDAPQKIRAAIVARLNEYEAQERWYFAQIQAEYQRKKSGGGAKK